MKHQYFGDVNDYRKYGLLRCLIQASGLRLGVCWLLTESDKSPDGEKRDYLRDPRRWRRYDPELYDKLQELYDPSNRRSVLLAEKWNVLPSAAYFSEVVSDSLPSRRLYFRNTLTSLSDCPLIFFDPDNGIEVPSVPLGSKGSSKYLYWSEAEQAYESGHSLIIYQHFPRAPRAAYTAKLAGALVERLKPALVDSFSTPHVLFLLVARPEHAAQFASAHRLIEQTWLGQIAPLAHVSNPFSGTEGQPMTEERENKKISLEELVVSTLAMTDALAKLLIAKGVITDAEFKAQLSTERANYLAVLKRMH